MDREASARQTMDSGFNCAQSVLTAFGDQTGLDREQALGVAGAFGGGMGRMAKTCGVVTGAFMVIGLKTGQRKDSDQEAKERTYVLVREFARRFAAMHGTLECGELLACDISRPEERLRAQETGLFKTLCPHYVTSAVAILGELLADI